MESSEAHTKKLLDEFENEFHYVLVPDVSFRETTQMYKIIMATYRIHLQPCKGTKEAKIYYRK